MLKDKIKKDIEKKSKKKKRASTILMNNAL